MNLLEAAALSFLHPMRAPGRVRRLEALRASGLGPSGQGLGLRLPLGAADEPTGTLAGELAVGGHLDAGHEGVSIAD